MAAVRILGKNAVFKIEASDGGAVVDVSADGNEITLTLELNNEDGTGFGVDWREFTLIDGTFSIDYTAFYAAAAGELVETFLGGASMATVFYKRDFEFYPNGTPIGVTKTMYSGSVYLAGFPITAPRGGLTTVRVRMSGASQLTRAVS